MSGKWAFGVRCCERSKGFTDEFWSVRTSINIISRGEEIDNEFECAFQQVLIGLEVRLKLRNPGKGARVFVEIFNWIEAS